MTKEQFKKQFNLTEDQFLGKEVIEGNLDLDSVTTLPEDISLTVGGNLCLRSVTTLPEGISLTIDGYLDLSSVTTLPEGISLTVGGYLVLNSNLKQKLKNYTKLDTTKPITFQNGKYIKVDGMFTEVVNKRGNVYKVKKLNQTKEFYLVTDGNGKFSHGDTLEEAKEDLIYKINSNLDKSKYKDLTLQSKLTFEEGIEAYRVITGACYFGVKDFVTTNKIKKTSYTVEEIIKLTSNSYGGSTFKEFFK